MRRDGGTQKHITSYLRNSLVSLGILARPHFFFVPLLKPAWVTSKAQTFSGNPSLFLQRISYPMGTKCLYSIKSARHTFPLPALYNSEIADMILIGSIFFFLMIHKIMVYLGTSLAVQWFKTLYFQCSRHGFDPWLGN